MKRALAVVLLVCVAAGVVAFILTRGPSPVEESAEITTRQRGANLVISGEVDVGGDRRSVRGTGQLDLRGERARLRLAASAPGLEDARGEGTDSILIGDDLYERSRYVENRLPPGKEWRRSRSTAAIQRRGQTALIDPRRTLAALRTADEVKEAGREPVRGRAATRYRATIRIDGRRVPVTVWLNRDGLVLRQDVAAGGASFSVFFEYLQRPEIRAPAARYVATG